MMHFIAHSCLTATTKLVCVSFSYFLSNTWGRKGDSGISEVFKYIHVVLDWALLVLLKV